MAPFPSNPIRVVIASTPAHLALVRAALERLCELMGFPEDTRGDVVLAVDEALANIIRHAYHGAPDKDIEVTFRPMAAEGGNGRLEVQLRDWGEQAPPGRIRSRDLGDVRPGGLGVHIMYSCMDSVEYAPMPDGGTRLTMVKGLRPRSDP